VAAILATQERMSTITANVAVDYERLEVREISSISLIIDGRWGML
jgi:hypothetical protein